MQLLNRNYVDGSKPDTPQGVSVANFQAGTGNLWDCLQSIGAGVWSVTAGTVNYTVANAGLSLIDASGGNVTINLPQISSAAAALAAAWFQFKRVDNTANTVTINRGGTDTIDGATSFNLVGQYDFQEIRCDGASAWRALNAFANAQRARDLIGAGVLSFRNKVRNGRVDLVQHGTSFAAAANGYTLDGWMWQTSGAQVVTVSQEAASLVSSEFQANLKVQVTTANSAPAAGNYAFIEQPIEGYLVRDLIGNPIAIRFEVQSPKAGTHSVTLVNLGFDRSYILSYQVAAANTPQLVTLALPAGLITAGSWNWTTGVGLRLRFALMAAASLTTSAGAWVTSASPGYVGVTGQVNCMDTVGNIFKITGVQLEKGGGSTPFEHRDIAEEMLLNYRYLQPSPAQMYGNAWATNGFTFAAQFNPPLRTSPSAASASIGTVNIVGVGNAAGVSGLALATLSAGFVRYVANTTSTLTVGAPIEVGFTALFSAEL